MTPDNTDDRTYIHNLLGISDDRATEIADEVRDILIKSRRVDLAIKQLAEKYDPESLLAGLRLMQLIRFNTEQRPSGVLTLHLQGQNAEQN